MLSSAPKPVFTSRYADPNNPASSGDPLALVTGGKLSRMALQPDPGSAGGRRGHGGGRPGLLGAGLGLLATRGDGDSQHRLAGQPAQEDAYERQSSSRRNEQGRTSTENAEFGRREHGSRAARRSQTSYKDEDENPRDLRRRRRRHDSGSTRRSAIDREDNYPAPPSPHGRSRRADRDSHQDRRGKNSGGGGGVVGGLKKVVQQDVLYLLIVNYPTEEELRDGVPH